MTISFGRVVSLIGHVADRPVLVIPAEPRRALTCAPRSLRRVPVQQSDVGLLGGGGVTRPTTERGRA